MWEVPPINQWEARKEREPVQKFFPFTLCLLRDSVSARSPPAEEGDTKHRHLLPTCIASLLSLLAVLPVSLPPLLTACTPQMKHQHFHPCLKLCFPESLGSGSFASGICVCHLNLFCGFKMHFNIWYEFFSALFCFLQISSPLIIHLIIQIDFPRSQIVGREKKKIALYLSNHLHLFLFPMQHRYSLTTWM